LPACFVADGEIWVKSEVNVLMDDTQTAFSMLLEDMKEKGQTEIVDLLRKCDYGFVETGYDNWDGGTYFYTLYIYLRLPIINNLSSEQIKEWQDVIANSAGRFFDEGNISLSECRIVPFKELFIDWDLIIEHCSPKELIDRVVNESRLLILCATGTSISEMVSATPTQPVKICCLSTETPIN
jgi:hypothetical protein